MAKEKERKRTITGEVVREVPQMPSHMFFQSNQALVPPYNVLVDTNFCMSRTLPDSLPLTRSMVEEQGF